jgi:hypothetical protein
VNERDTTANGTLLTLASRMSAGAGRGRPRAIARLSGGKNNQVYRIDMDAGAPLALKCYFNDPRDGRDRLSTEWNFLDRAWQSGIRAIPQPLLRDRPAQAALYDFVPGRKLVASELEAAHVDTAAEFIRAINLRPDPALPPASESCFSIADHLQIVERRLSRFVALDPRAPRVEEADRFISATLRPVWDAVRNRIAREIRALGLDMHSRLADAECCLSPSDFGFHNALAADDGRLVFLDFEYAGRDDPAKLVVDFFCQPEVPVPVRHLDRFIASLAEALKFDAAAMARCRLLLDACRIKWVCIMLNDFLPVGAARRSFAATGEWNERCARQIEKARTKIGEIVA